MQPLPQSAPISDMHKRMDATLDLMDNGPVILMARSKPRAVMIAPDEWDKIANRMQFLEQDRRNRIAEAQFAKMRNGVEGEDYFEFSTPDEILTIG